MMKKAGMVLLLVFGMILAFFACKKSGPSTEISSDPIGGICEHEYAITSFVTQETDLPYAAIFTCSKCGNERTDSFSYTDIEIPLVSLTGDTSGISKENKVNARISFKNENGLSFESDVTLKLQGKSSIGYEKRNYSVNLIDGETGKKRNLEIVEGWGSGSKYVLKACFTEPTYARNIALSKLYGQVARGRDSDDKFASLVNGGAIDGFPVLLYLNGNYVGIYNWVIRKDKWLYGMGDEDKAEAVLYGSETAFFSYDGGIDTEGILERSIDGWEIEYENTKVGEEGWSIDSFNEMLSFVKNADDALLRERAAEYLDIDRTIDVIVFNSVFGDVDNVRGNQVWCTYDGKKWAPVPYDLDRTLGRDGGKLNQPQRDPWLGENLIYEKILSAFRVEIYDRYKSLRAGVFTTSNVRSILDRTMSGLDQRLFDAEWEKWGEALWRESSNAAEITSFESELSYIENYLNRRFEYCDSLFERLKSGTL